MGIETDHPSVSGLNAYGGINMYGNGISNLGSLNMLYNGNTYPVRTIFNLGIRDQNGGVHHFTFVHGILSS